MNERNDSEAEAAREALQVIMQWVVSPLVQTGKSVGEKLDRVSSVLERIADGIDRMSPPRPAPDAVPASNGT